MSNIIDMKEHFEWQQLSNAWDWWEGQMPKEERDNFIKQYNDWSDEEKDDFLVELPGLVRAARIMISEEKENEPKNVCRIRSS